VPRHVPSPGKLFSDANEEAAARRASTSGAAAAAKRQREAQRAFKLPTGPAGVTFSDAECAELHRLLGLFYNAPGWPYRVSRDGFVRVQWHQFRGWLVGQPPDSELRDAWEAINELLRSDHWYCWPPKGGANPGQPPHHRVCSACKASLRNGSLVKEQHRASRCDMAYQCPDGACGPNGC
jgi:hypothetical protein